MAKDMSGEIEVASFARGSGISDHTRRGGFSTTRSEGPENANFGALTICMAVL